MMSTAIDDDYGIIYSLLDNGSLILTKSTNKDEGKTYTNKYFSFEGIGTVDTWLI
jgi:hypothetical protein